MQVPARMPALPVYVPVARRLRIFDFPARVAGAIMGSRPVKGSLGNSNRFGEGRSLAVGVGIRGVAAVRDRFVALPAGPWEGKQ